MAWPPCVRGLALFTLLVLLACPLCAGDAGVGFGSDLGVAQQVTQVQKKLHEAHDKLEAAEARKENLEKHAEAIEAELAAAKEAAEAKLSTYEEEKTNEEEAAAQRLNDALAKVEQLEKEVAALSTVKGQLEMERPKLLKWAEDAKKAERLAKQVETLEKDKTKLLQRAEKAEQSEAAQRKLVLELKEEASGLRNQAAEAAAKLAKVEAALVQARAELSAKEQVLSSWLPPWAAAKINPLQEAFLVHWFKHGHPVYRQVSDTVSSTASSAHAWARPHLSTASSASARAWQAVGQPAVGFVQDTHQKYRPLVTAEWEEHVTPLLTSAHSGATAAYSRAATVIGPHANKVRQGVTFTLEAVWKHPRFVTVSTAAAPHVRKLQEMLHPLTQAAAQAVQAGKDIHHKSANFVHEQLQAHPLTADHATLSNARALLYVLLAIPAVLILASPAVSRKARSKVPAVEDALSKKKRKLVPGKPGQGTLGKRSSGLNDEQSTVK